MANVVKKHSISSELAQKMVDEAVAKARELGVTENVAILDDGVWTYEAPYAAVTLIKDHLAFYPDRVDAIEERMGDSDLFT